MKISKQWLCDFVALPETDEELYHVLQMAGVGVEEREDDTWTLEVTANRGDWLSAVGLARDIAAMTDKHLHVPSHDFSEAESETPIGERVVVDIENPADCPRYAARLLENIRVGPSPDWMQQRLIQCGMRPVNNVVDITNYVMLETGQPLHAFDADKVLFGGIHRVEVRRARDGEKITTLDDVQRSLTPEVLLITDGERPLAVAGVMGGLDSEVTESTTKVLLESAHFAPARVRRSKRVIGLASEASRRFERWVDPNSVVKASNRAAQLLNEYAGASIVQGVVDRYVQPVEDARATLRISRCNAVLGLRLTRDQIVKTFKRLGFKIGLQTDELIEVSIPTWRRDIEREIDLIEEVARVHGYENIPTTLPRNANPTAGRSLSQRLEDRAKQALLRCGLSEIVTYSLQSPASVTRAGLENSTAVKLRNPLSEDFSQLRTSLLPSLLDALARNPRTPVRYFELAKVYVPKDAANPEAQQPHENAHLGLALLNAPTAPHWQKATPTVDFFTLKSVVANLLQAMGAPQPQLVPAQRPTFHPGRCALLLIDGQELGVLGEVHPEVAGRYDLPHRAYLAEIEWNALVRHVQIAPRFTAPVKFPPADRDLALVLKNEVAAANVESTLRDAGGELLEAVRIFDVYTGPPVPEGWKSLALSLRFRAANRTLTEDEIEAAMTRLRESAENKLGAQQRI